MQFKLEFNLVLTLFAGLLRGRLVNDRSTICSVGENIQVKVSLVHTHSSNEFML